MGAVAFVLWASMVVIAAVSAVLDQIWPWLLAFVVIAGLAGLAYVLWVWSGTPSAPRVEAAPNTQPYWFQAQHPYGFYTPHFGGQIAQPHPVLQPAAMSSTYAPSPGQRCGAPSARSVGNGVVLHQRRHGSRFVAGSQS